MLTLRFKTTRAIGAAIALTIAGVTTDAGAQTTGGTTGGSTMQDSTRRETARPSSDRRERIRKDAGGMGQSGSGMGQSGSGMSGGMSGGSTSGMTGGDMMRRDTVFVARSDTTVVQCNCGATTASGGEVLPFRRINERFFGNGAYLGVSGATTLPVGDLYKAYSEGWGVAAHLGWDPRRSPFGARITVGYSELNGRTPGPRIRRPLGRNDINGDFGGSGNDVEQYFANLDGKLRIPFGRFLGATSGVYAVAGAGVHHFRNYNRTLFLTNNFFGRGFSGGAGDAALQSAANGADQSTTRLGVNGGLGASLGIRNFEIFAEGRYHRAYTPNRAINYVPVVLGVQVH